MRTRPCAVALLALVSVPLARGQSAATGTITGFVSDKTGSIIPGTFCVTVYDVGNVTDSVNYTVTVTHP